MDTISTDPQHIETVIIGAGQAGLSTGYYLRKRGREFLILDSYERVGDNWRCHWDSLRLYSPALAAGLPGMDFPAPRTSYPTKDQMADFLEAYRARFDLPVRGGVRVRTVGRGRRAVRRHLHRRVVVHLRQRGGRDGHLRAYAERAGVRGRAGPCHPAAALQRLQAPVPAQARRCAGGRRLALRRRHRLRGRHGGTPGGAQRSHPRARSRSGSEKPAAKVAFPVLFFLAKHVLTMRTPLGRKIRPEIRAHGGPLIRVKKEDLARVGVEMTDARTVGVHGRPAGARRRPRCST